MTILYTNAATEARTIMLGLKAVRDRPALDELRALIGEIAKSDLGLQEIERAKIRMSEPDKERATKCKPTRLRSPVQA